MLVRIRLRVWNCRFWQRWRERNWYGYRYKYIDIVVGIMVEIVVGINLIRSGLRQLIGGKILFNVGEKAGTNFELILLNKVHTYGILCNESHLIYVENFKYL